MSYSSRTRQKPSSTHSSRHTPRPKPPIILAYITDLHGAPIDPRTPRPEYLRTASGCLFERNPSCTPHSLRSTTPTTSSSPPYHSHSPSPPTILAHITDATGAPIDARRPCPAYRRTAAGRLFKQDLAVTAHANMLRHKTVRVGDAVERPGPEKCVEVVKKTAYTVMVGEKGRRSCVVLVESVGEEEADYEDVEVEQEEETDVWTDIAKEEVLVVRGCCAGKFC